MEAGTISLYLDLEPGLQADLETVARAALAFSAAINELAYAIDPGLEIRVEFANATTGSLSLNSIVKAARDIGRRLLPENPLTIRAVIATILVWFGTDMRTTLSVEAVQHILGETRAAGISDDDAAKIAEIVRKAIAEGVGQRHVEGVYRALEPDPAVKGVGSTVEPGARPQNIVPRDSFPARGGLTSSPEVTIDKRVKRERVALTLVSPVLVASLSRRWRFSSPSGPISAAIKDARFLSRLLSGQERIPMRANIEMDVLLETSEERRDGVWVVTDRAVLQVTHVRPAPLQRDLFITPPDEDDGEDRQ